MIAVRDLYSSAPPPRDSRQNNPTLLVSWWCTGFALAIILVRLAGRKVRTERLFREDTFMALSIIPLCARMGVVHLVLLWGTNNAIASGLAPEDIRHREIGSKLVLASRVMYAMFLWIAKLTVTEFLKRLTDQVWKRSYEIGLQFIRWFLFITFIAVIAATLAECHPFNHYWQVSPDPGVRCRQGVAQLLTMGVSDTITDLLIVCFPIPIVIASNMPLKRKISLILLFALSLVLVGITIYRVIGVTSRHGEQQFRSLLASAEILAAAAVSNAIVLGSFVRDRGAKKQRFRFGSTAGASSNAASASAPKRAITARYWGSDADLVGDLGMRCSPQLSDGQTFAPRPAPVALPTAEQASALTPAPMGQDWSFPRKRRSSIDTADIDEEKLALQIANELPPDPEVPSTPRGMSFFDVGGLLFENEAPRSPRTLSLQAAASPTKASLNVTTNSPHQSLQTLPSPPSPMQPHHSPSSARADLMPKRGSQALLQDIGGLLPSTDRRDSPHITVSSSPPLPQHNGTSSSSCTSTELPNSRRGLSLVDILRESQPMNGFASSAAQRTALPSRQHRQGQRQDRTDLAFQDVGGLLNR